MAHSCCSSIVFVQRHCESRQNSPTGEDLNDVDLYRRNYLVYGSSRPRVQEAAQQARLDGAGVAFGVCSRTHSGSTDAPPLLVCWAPSLSRHDRLRYAKRYQHPRGRTLRCQDPAALWCFRCLKEAGRHADSRCR